MSKNKFEFKIGYNYLQHYRNDYTNLANHIEAVCEIGYDLINGVKSTDDEESVFELNSKLTYLASLLLPKIEIFCSRWNELFHYTFHLEFKDNNNPFFFVNNVFILSKHIEREINNFYHGHFRIKDNIDKKEIEKINKIIEKLKKQNIYDFMKFLDEYETLSRKAYINQCKKVSDEGPLRDFLGIKFEDFRYLTNAYLPQFKGYIDLLFKNIESVHSQIFNIKLEYSEIYKMAMEIIKAVKFNKKIWNFFIVKEWNNYIDKLQNLMYFYVFIYTKLEESAINNYDKFKNSEFAKNTDWYAWYSDDRLYWIEKYKKNKLINLIKVKRN